MVFCCVCLFFSKRRKASLISKFFILHHFSLIPPPLKTVRATHSIYSIALNMTSNETVWFSMLHVRTGSDKHQVILQTVKTSHLQPKIWELTLICEVNKYVQREKVFKDNYQNVNCKFIGSLNSLSDFNFLLCVHFYFPYDLQYIFTILVIKKKILF